MTNTLINLVVEWARAPAAFRLEFDGARVLSGGINLGWGAQVESTHSFTFTSTDEVCRICFGLEAEGTEKDGTRVVVRVVDTDQPFSFAVDDLLAQRGGELELVEPAVKLYAEVNWFAML